MVPRTGTTVVDPGKGERLFRHSFEGKGSEAPAEIGFIGPAEFPSAFYPDLCNARR